LLLVLAYIGVVFVLPPVLGRRAHRSRKALIAFLSVCVTLAGLGIIVCLDVKEMSQRVLKKDLPSGHEGEDFMMALWLAPFFAGSLFFGVLLGLAGWASGAQNRPPKDDKPPPTSP